MRTLLLLLLAATLPAHAGERVHRLGAGESLETLATDVYGVAAHAEVLRSFNALDAEPIATGREIRLPLADAHAVREGESWAGLAERYWQVDPEESGTLGAVLAELCGQPAERPPEPGARLAIPVLVRHRVRSGDTLMAISRRFYGSGAWSEKLARLNGVTDARRLWVGREIRVPVLTPAQAAEPADSGGPSVSTAPPTVAAPAAPPEDPTRVRVTALEADVRVAINAYLEGDYEEARDRLERLRPSVLAHGDARTQCELLTHLTFVYVAFERGERACETYGALRALAPDLTWEPDRVSPKIRDVTRSCDEP